MIFGKRENMNLLLIMPNFFDYPQTIIEELTEMGYNVDFFDDRPSTNGWIKALIRLNRKLIHHYISDYFKKMMTTVRSKKYDVVLLISGQSLSLDENMISQIRESQVEAKFILYQWDSLRNFPYIGQIQKYFDECYSFDKDDVDNSNVLRFLPLFYSQRYERIGRQKKKLIKYDFCFVGTAHPQKYKFIKQMSEQLISVYPNQFIYFYYPSRLVFFYRKIMSREIRKSKYKEFNYVPIGADEIERLFSVSKCVLDSAQEGQSGLTIRVFEALGAKKKLITTNSDITRYDFFCEENIYIYKGSFDLNSLFFTQPYKDIEESIYCKYSLKCWLETLLE